MQKIGQWYPYSTPLYMSHKIFDKHLVVIQKIKVSMNYDNSKKLVVGKMKNETGGFAIEEFVGLKANIYSFLVEALVNMKIQMV